MAVSFLAIFGAIAQNDETVGIRYASIARRFDQECGHLSIHRNCMYPYQEISSYEW